LATTAAEVADAAQQFGRCIVQRRRPGTVVSFAGVAAPGGLLGYAVSRYARTWPAVAGNASFSETFSPPAGLVDAVQAFVDELEWQGTFELELLDSSGQLAAIDFNPRPYGSLSLAVAAGAPLPALWCAWCAGERRAQVAARPGVRYRWEDADLRHALWQMRKGNWPAGIAAVRPQRATVHAYFRLGDPGPIAARALQLLREEAHRMRSP
jgi:predicted ATP-grasp superfamily ATP-dependent carboligase